MKNGYYIQPETFKDFCTNQKELIEILNHRMTGIEKGMISILTDVTWLKKSLWTIVGLVTTILAVSIIKLIAGV